MTEWIKAISVAVIALSVTACSVLRISDEIRFRRAITDVEAQKERGAPIVLSQRIHGKTGDHRRRRAAEFIQNRIK